VAGQPTSAASAASTSSAASASSAPISSAAASGPADPTSSSPYGGPGLPPGQVTLKDLGTSVTLTWLDPSSGQIPFIVAGGRSDAPESPIVTVPAGRTTQTIYGLNPRFDYCFTVAAVWSTDQIQASPPACTKRKLSTSST
jgi:hypothetical protein